MRKTKQDLKEELKRTRANMATMNKIRQGAEVAFKGNPSKENAKGLRKATSEWIKMYINVQTLKARI